MLVTRTSDFEEKNKGKSNSTMSETQVEPVRAIIYLIFVVNIFSVPIIKIMNYGTPRFCSPVHYFVSLDFSYSSNFKGPE